MNPKRKQDALADIDAALGYQAPYGGTSATSEWSAMMVAAIERWAPPGSAYRKMLSQIELFPNKYQHEDVRVCAVIQALRADIDADRLTTFEELVHAAVFDDLGEQAAYYLDEGHLLAAAVVIGAALEEHLRQLSPKHGIAVTQASAKGKVQPRKASEMNDWSCPDLVDTFFNPVERGMRCRDGGEEEAARSSDVHRRVQG